MNTQTKIIETHKEFYWNTYKDGLVDVALVHTLSDGNEEVEYLKEHIPCLLQEN
jgi:hypothetical protein